MACTLLGQLPRREGGITTRPNETATSVYRVLSDSADDTPAIAIAATGVSRGDAYPGNARLTVQNINAFHEDDTSYKRWVVVVEYGTIGGSLNPLPGGSDDNPLNRPAIESWTFTEIQEVANKGRLMDPDTNEFGEDEVAVCNSAGDLFTDPPLRTLYIPTLNFRRTESSFDYSIAAAYVGKVNSEAWLSSAVHEALCINISADRLPNESGFGSYWDVTYQFVFKPGGWYNAIQDRGFYRRVDFGDGPKFFRVCDDDGTPVDTPAFLDGDGNTLTIDPGTPLEDQCVYRTYLFHGEVDFDALGLTP